MDYKAALAHEYDKFQSQSISNITSTLVTNLGVLTDALSNNVQQSAALHNSVLGLSDSVSQLGDLHRAGHEELISTIKRPKTIVRGPDGKISGVI